MRIRPGIEVMLASGLLKDKNIGLVTNHTGNNYELKSNFSLMLKAGYTIEAIFSPEHGIYGDHPDGQYVEGSTLEGTDIPIFSLYGAIQKPTPEMLENIDILVFDIQDIGARYYTYMSTMIHSMEAAAENGVAFAILDRPNPIGGQAVEGNITEDGWISTVAYAPIAIRHGMTAAEIGLLMSAEKGWPKPIVIPVEGWSRNMYFNSTGFPWVPTSPSAPTLDMAILYPGTCLIEGTNLSEGRGTSAPFQTIGAPWIDGLKLSNALNGLELPGIKTRPVYFRPTFSKWAEEVCQGVQIHIFEPGKVNAVELGVHLLFTIRNEYLTEFKIIPPGPSGKHFLDLLSGGTQLSETLKNHDSPDSVLNSWRTDAESFSAKRKDFLIYT